MRRVETPLLAGCVALVFAASFLVGRYPVSLAAVLHELAAAMMRQPPPESAIIHSVVMDVRLPRIAVAALVGAGLSLSGACYQGVFRNPLVSPFVLGVSAGAGFGAALAILFLPQPGAVPTLAFVFGLLAVGLCFLMARSYRAAPTLVLILSGIVVGALFTALLSLLKYLADPDSKLPLIEFWLLGSLSSVTNRDALLLLGLFVPCGGVLWVLRWRLNLLAMGDDEARSLGMRAGQLRAVVILASTLIAASTVAVAGIIGWVGLVVPHAARILVGADFRRVLPASAAIGACYLMLVDDLARTITQAELPIGVLTALVGAPVFALLLRRTRLGWA